MRGTDASPLGISSVLYVHYNLHTQLHLYSKILRQIVYFFPVLFGLKSLHFLLLKDRVYFHFSLELFSFCLYISDNEHHILNHCICSFFLHRNTALQTVMWDMYTCIPIIAMRAIKAWFRYWSLCHPLPFYIVLVWMYMLFSMEPDMHLGEIINFLFTAHGNIQSFSFDWMIFTWLSAFLILLTHLFTVADRFFSSLIIMKSTRTKNCIFASIFHLAFISNVPNCRMFLKRPSDV